MTASSERSTPGTHVPLVQVEELVAGSNTGKAPQLAGYYSYWEMAVFNSLVMMVLRGLDKLHAMLGKRPLFKVRVSAGRV
jgi:dynein heavy chain